MSTSTADQSIQQLIDAEEIKRVIYEYAYHLDMNHPDELAALIVEECEVIYGPNFGAKGIDEYKKTLEGIGTFFTATSHHVSNTVIEFTGPDEATARSVLYAWHRYTRERPDSHVWGQYHDEMVRSDGQ